MIERIVHFSDLHIRLFKDHDQYRHVLKQAFKEWGTIAPDRIVFTGDRIRFLMLALPLAVRDLIAPEVYTCTIFHLN